MVAELFVGIMDATSASKSILRPTKKHQIAFVSYCDEPYIAKVYNRSLFDSSASQPVLKKEAIVMEDLILKAREKGFENIEDNTKMFISSLNEFFVTRNIIPYKTFPIADGGVSIEIKRGESYYNFEIANDGDASFYKENGDNIPEGWDYSYAGLVNRLEEEFNG